MRRTYLLLIAVFSFAVCIGQSALSVEKTASEQVYLHLDKEVYLPGETIFFKGYIVQQGLLSANSSSLYVDMAGANGKIVQRKIFPVYGGSADGSMDMPLPPSGGPFFIRAYTDRSKAIDSGTVVTRIISVAPSNTENSVGVMTQENTIVQLRLFPEGGSLTEGVRNTVAFEALQANGIPASITGALYNHKGDSITCLKQVHNGMGKFQFTPERGMQYYIRWTGAEKETSTTSLPMAIHDNINLHTEQMNGKIFYIVSTQSSAENFDELYVTLNDANGEVYRTKIEFKGRFLTSGMIGISQRLPGILSVMVLDKNNTPVSERIVFVNQQNVMNPISLSVVGGLSKRGKQTIEIDMPDTTFSNMSLAVYDDNFNDDTANHSTIASQLLLTNELRGRIYHPSYYFSDTTKQTREHLDLLMLTHGWRRIGYTEEMETDGNSYITIEGSVRPLKKRGKKPKEVVLLIKNKGGKDYLFPANVMPDGQFKATGLIFSDSATVYCSIGKNQEQTEDYEVKIEGGLPLGSPSDFFIPAGYQNNFFVTAKSSSTNTMLEAFTPRIEKPKDKNTLQEVVIKTRKLTRHEELEQRYTFGFFRGGVNSIGIDVASDSLAWSKQDIYNYLYAKIPRLCVGYRLGEKYLGAGSSCDENSLLIFVNESLSSNEVLSGISIESIAYIKYVPQYFGTRNNGGFSPAVSIYLKKGEDLYAGPSKNVSFAKQVLRGYSIVKEFYSPDYAALSSDKESVDARTTLLWQPYIFTNSSNRKVVIPFYNNDLSTKLRVVLQGMDEQGRFIYEERLLQ